MTDVVTTNGMTTPGAGRDAPLPKRAAGRGLLLSTWLGRSLRLAYVGVDGKGVETSAILLDWCGTGPVFNLAGGKVLIAWDRLVMLELSND